MSEQPSSPTLGVQFLHNLEKVQAEIGAENTAAILNEITDIYNIVRQGFDAEGKDLILKLHEAIKLHEMATEAAEEGKGIGPIWQKGDIVCVERAVVIGSLKETYDEGLVKRQRRENIRVVTANDASPQPA